MKNKQSQSGFSLIELMIAVVVIGILAAVAIPNYQDYVRRSALQEAFAALSDQRVKLEQFYQNNRNYGTGTCGNDGTTAQVSFAATGKFTYACAFGSGANANQSYTLTATGSIGSSADHVYTLDSSNLKKTTKFKGTTVSKSCWLVKGSEC